MTEIPYRVIDLRGQRFGKLLVDTFTKTTPESGAHWICKCDCGKNIELSSRSLKKDKRKSCGCLIPEFYRRAGLKKVKDLKGKRFGTLTATKHLGKINAKSRTHYWECRCDCGAITKVSSSNLIGGAVRNCGCIRTRKTSERNSTHKLSKSREYIIWASMLTRCSNPKRDSWENYGGRGIRVCDRWLKFENFLQDMGKAPSGKHTLDRINNDGNYSPSNCRWATMSRQARNRRSTRMVTYNGQTKAVSDWADEYGLTLSCLTSRLDANKWSVKHCLTTPKGQIRLTKG